MWCGVHVVLYGCVRDVLQCVFVFASASVVVGVCVLLLVVRVVSPWWLSLLFVIVVCLV